LLDRGDRRIVAVRLVREHRLELAAEHAALGVDFLDGQDHAVIDVFSDLLLNACRHADSDRLLLRQRAAGAQRCCRCNRAETERRAPRPYALAAQHRFSPLFGTARMAGASLPACRDIRRKPARTATAILTSRRAGTRRATQR